MKLKCYLLDRMVEAKEKVVIPPSGKKYNAYYCNLCGVAECQEDERLVGMGGTVAFTTSVFVKKNYDEVKMLAEGATK